MGLHKEIIGIKRRKLTHLKHLLVNTKDRILISRSGKVCLTNAIARSSIVSSPGQCRLGEALVVPFQFEHSQRFFRTSGHYKINKQPISYLTISHTNMSNLTQVNRQCSHQYCPWTNNSRTTPPLNLVLDRLFRNRLRNHNHT